MHAIQLDLFCPSQDHVAQELRDVRERLEQVKQSSDKVRRGLYVRHNELAKMYMELQLEFDMWKSTLSKGLTN